MEYYCLPCQPHSTPNLSTDSTTKRMRKEVSNAQTYTRKHKNNTSTYRHILKQTNKRKYIHYSLFKQTNTGFKTYVCRRAAFMVKRKYKIYNTGLCPLRIKVPQRIKIFEKKVLIRYIYHLKRIYSPFPDVNFDKIKFILLTWVR